MANLLTLDIGGTNPTIAMLNEETILLVKPIEKSADSIIIPINEFLHECADRGWTTDSCSIAVAGPVRDHRTCVPTNTHFLIDREEIRKNSYLKNIVVCNDVEAIAYALDGKLPEHTQITEQTLDPNGNRVVIAAGTGLGIAYLFKTPTGFNVVPTEAGHAWMPDLLNCPLLFQFLKNIYNAPPSIETLASGQAFPKLFEFFINNPEETEKLFDQFPHARILTSMPDAELTMLLAHKDASTKIAQSIQVNAKANLAMRIVLHNLAQCVQSAALSIMPTGGIFLTGGIIRKHYGLLEKDFSEKISKNWKPNISLFLKNIPLRVITDENVSHIGAARAFKKMYVQN